MEGSTHLGRVRLHQIRHSAIHARYNGAEIDRHLAVPDVMRDDPEFGPFVAWVRIKPDGIHALTRRACGRTRSGCAIDTDVVRHLVRNRPGRQGRWSVRSRRSYRGTVMRETEWVLRGAYAMPAARIVATSRALAGLPGVLAEDAAIMIRARGWAEAGMEFADAPHLAAPSGCEGFLTFDRRFGRRGSGMATIPPVVTP